MVPTVSYHRKARANLNKNDDKYYILQTQHQSKYPRDQESVSIEIPPFRPQYINLLKSDFYYYYLNVQVVKMQILGLLGIYFDAELR